MRARLLSTATLMGFLAPLMAAFTLASCGAITEEDLIKWSANDEGLARIEEMMQDGEVPFDKKVRAIQILVSKGWSSRIKGIVDKYEDSKELANVVVGELIKTMKTEPGKEALLARDGVYALMGQLEETHLEKAQVELVNWIFQGVEPTMDRAAIWESVEGGRMGVGERIGNLNRLKDLGKHAAEKALILLEKSVEVEGFGLVDFVTWYLEFNDPELKKMAWQALVRQFQASMDHMKANDSLDTDFVKEIALISLFKDVDSALYIREFINTVNALKSLSLTQRLTMQSTLIAPLEALLKQAVPATEYHKYADIVLGLKTKFLQELSDPSGNLVSTQALLIVSEVGIPGMDKVELIVKTKSTDKDGKEVIRKAWKPYLQKWEPVEGEPGKFRPAFKLHTFIFGMTKDYLTPLVDKEFEQLTKEFTTKWEAEQAAAKAANPEAKPADKPDFPLDPAFREELHKRIDKNITPLVGSWSKNPVKLSQAFAVAGLRFLATPGADAELTALKKDTTDLSDYFGKGMTTATLADYAAKSIEYGNRLVALERENQNAEVIRQADIVAVRDEMQADLLLNPAELAKKYDAMIEVKKAEVKEIKELQAQQQKQLARDARMYCINCVKEHVPVGDKTKLEITINDITKKCWTELYNNVKDNIDPSVKHPFDVYKLTDALCRSAVTVGVNQRELLRKHLAKEKLRAYLGSVAMDTFTPQDPKSRSMTDFIKSAKESFVADGKVSKEMTPKVTEIKNSVFGYLRGEGYQKKAEETKDPFRVLPAEIDEYEQTLESPDGFVLAKLFAVYYRIEYRETLAPTAPGEKGEVKEVNLFKDEAKARFSKEAFFKENPEMLEFLADHVQEAFHVLADMEQNRPDDQLRATWALSQEEVDQFKIVAAEIRKSVDKVWDAAATEKKIAPEALAFAKTHYPAYSMMITAVVETTQERYNQRRAEAEKAAEEAKKEAQPEAKAKEEAPKAKEEGKAPAPAPEEPAKAPEEPAEKPAAEQPAAENK